MSARVLDDCCTRCPCGRICCDNKGTSDCGHDDQPTCPDCCEAAHRRCGRLDDHARHEWRGHQWTEERGLGCSSTRPVTFLCSGVVVIEGGWLEVMP